MKLIKSLFLTVFLLSGLHMSAQEKKTLSNIGNENQATFKFDHETFNFGTIQQGESITHEFKFTNTGSEPLIISRADGSCGCTVPQYPKEPIMKGQSGVIKVTFNSAGKMGVQDRTVTIVSNATESPLVLHMKGNVDKPAEQPTSK